MKLKTFLNSPHHTIAAEVEAEAGALDSNSLASLPTSAPGTLIFLKQSEFTGNEPALDAFVAWCELCNHLAAFHPRPQLN